MTVSRQNKDALFEQFASVGKTLGSPKRLELLDVLAQGERSVESLAQATSLKLTTASAHLQVLRHGGLVDIRKDGTRIYYRLASNRVAQLYVTLQVVAMEHLAETEKAAHEFLGEDEFEAVGRDELLDRMREGDVVLVDVRPTSEYQAGHIEGAISIPLEELADRLSELPSDGDVVAYCRGEFCLLAYDAVRLLRARGHRAQRMHGGMLEWRLENREIAAA